MTPVCGHSSTDRSTSPWSTTGGSTPWTSMSIRHTMGLWRWPSVWGWEVQSPKSKAPIAPRFCPTKSSRRSSGLACAGAGFPTGKKWRMVRQQPGDTKYVICNGDEGDPGAFMDRMILESFPYRVIEGLAIAAVAVGAHEAIFYVRHEYPQALRRVKAALAECERRGWLGNRLRGSDYQLHITIKEGAGAFVCGEETALIASVEGRRGMPRLRPPFPAQSGLWGKP